LSCNIHAIQQLLLCLDFGFSPLQWVPQLKQLLYIYSNNSYLKVAKTTSDCSSCLISYFFKIQNLEKIFHCLKACPFIVNRDFLRIVHWQVSSRNVVAKYDATLIAIREQGELIIKA